MNGTVMIIDPDAYANTRTETLLRLYDVRVRAALSATDAAEIVRREAVAVVLLDVSSPGTHGFEILRQLRGRFRHLRIAVMTDWEETAVERLARRLGADAFLRKPISAATLIRTVEEMLVIAAPRFGLRAG